MVPALACIKWFDCHLPGAVVSQGISRPNAENCSGFTPPTRQSASIEAELLGLTPIYSERVRVRAELYILCRFDCTILRNIAINRYNANVKDYP